MKRLVCLLLAMMLCMGVACADALEMNGITLNIPAGWCVEDSWQDAELCGLTLSCILDKAPQNIFVSRSNFDNWDSMASVGNGLKGLLAGMMMDEMEKGELCVQEYVTLRDGGLALKVVYTTNDISRGVVNVLSKDGMAILSVNAAKDQSAQCDAWLSEMLLPLQVQETIEVGGLLVGLPAGFVKNDENGLYFSEYNEAIKVFTLDMTQEDVSKLVANMSDEEVLLLMLLSQIGDLEYSNIQSESLEREGLSALISSMDVTVNGNSGCMGALTALSGDAVVGVSYMGNQGSQQAAAELMKVITAPLQENVFSINGMKFLCPEGFKIADYEKSGETVSVMISDQLLPEMAVVSTPLTEEETQMDVRMLLSTKIQEEFSDVYGSEEKIKIVEYDEATAFHITWYMEDIGIKYANGIAFVATKDHLIRIYSKWPNADTEYVGSVLDGMLPAPAGGETVSKGNVTLNIPGDWQLEESVQEDGRTKYAAQGAKGELFIHYWSAMPDNLRGMIEGMDVQTALEIQLSMLANEIGVEGITIDYAQNESGVHMVTSAFTHPQYAVGGALLLDGDAFWIIEIDSSANEEEARVLLDSVLEQVR